jgi:uncharacterized damage-inducible protein DinB
MATPVTIATAYPGWEVYQQQLTAAIAPLTSEQLSIRLAPHLRSVMELTAHIISARVWWFHVVMNEGPESLKPMVEWDDEGAPTRTAAELVAGLEVTWDLLRSCLSRWTLADLEQVFVRPGGDPSRARSRQWIIWHIVEHDLHHGGEISFSLGANNLPAINL